MTVAILACVAWVLGTYVLGRGRALALASGRRWELAAQPPYHGAFLAIAGGVPVASFMLLWWLLHGTVVDWVLMSELREGSSASTHELRALLEQARQFAMSEWRGVALDEKVGVLARRVAELTQISVIGLVAGSTVIGFTGTAIGWRRQSRSFQARVHVEAIVRLLLLACSTLAILTTLGIVLSLVFEAARFFRLVSPLEFFFGLSWSPQTALRADQIGSSGAFGAVPVFAGTLLITVIALAVAVPAGLLAAIYLSEYASERTRTYVKPIMELLAGIPTVVYGFFAALSVAPVIRTIGSSLGLDVSSESALAAGVVMGVMIVPFVSSLSDDVIRSVPQALRDAGLALGATHAEMVRQVVLPAALPGIVGAILLATSRAIGETMIVVMAAGMSAHLTANPFEGVTTVTVQIVTLLVGDQEFDSAKTLAAFALGLVLFVITLALNVVALRTVRKYREQYD